MCFMCRGHGAKSRTRFLELFVKAMRESKKDHVSSPCCRGVWEEREVLEKQHLTVLETIVDLKHRRILNEIHTSADQNSGLSSN